MRLTWPLLLVLVLAGCVANPSPPATSTGPGPAPTLNKLEAAGATIIDQGGNRTFEWKDTIGAGAAPPLVTGSLLAQFAHMGYKFPVDGSVAVVTLAPTSAQTTVTQLRTDDNKLACVARSGRTCAIQVTKDAKADWSLTITSLTPQGGPFDLKVTLSPLKPVYGIDPSPGGNYTVYDGKASGGEPTLAVLKDGRVLVASGSHVVRMDAGGAFTDVSPPVDKSTSQTLDPFLVGDPTTGRVYVSQLASCMRLSWTDNGGDAWTTNPFVCAGPDQHHQKIAVGPGPLGRMVHVATMNLASWLTTDHVVITHSRSIDGGVTWTQNPAEAGPASGMEAHAVGNIAVTDAGAIQIIAYLCDGFVDAPYHGVGVGRSTNMGATWTWQKIDTGSGRCEGIDPGIWTVGKNVYALWEDMATGVPSVWYAMSVDDGVTWSKPLIVPTPGLGTFVFTDAVASKDRVAAAFLATPDTVKGPTQADGWSRWYPYVVSMDLSTPYANWTIQRLQDDPVQIGPICMDGPMCLDGARNLLDFIDIQFGPDGRLYVAYPDGCSDTCKMPWESRGSDLHVAVENKA